MLPPARLPVSARWRAVAALPHRVDTVRGLDTTAVDTVAEGAGLTPVLLVHGLAVSHRYWAPTIAAMAGNRRVLAPDLPGVGGTSDPDRPLTLGDLVDGLVAWMDVVGLRSAVLVGHSLGCHVVAEVAARHPDRVAAVVLVSPAVDPGRWPIWQQGVRLALDGLRERPSLLPIAGVDYLRVGARRMLQTVHRAARLDLLQILGRVHRPTLVVDGARDLMVTRAWAARTAAVAGGSLVVVPAAPHGLPWTHPETLVELIRSFEDELPTGGPSSEPPDSVGQHPGTD